MVSPDTCPTPASKAFPRIPPRLRQVATTLWYLLVALADRPAAAFTVLSISVGLLLIVVTPPLRGPDESQHFLRAYGIAAGDFVPSTTDAEGRKGLSLPSRFKEDFAFFDALPSKRGDIAFGQAMRDYYRQVAERPAQDGPEREKFVPYAGAEGYAPIAYIPHAAAALVARVLGLDFLPTTYLMRVSGLLALTAVVAYAIALTPALAWAFVAIAMLPSAAYARAVISADGAALAGALMVTAVCLRAAYGFRHPARWLWYALCALTKPPQLAFVVLELMVAAWRGPRAVQSAAIVLPAIMLAVVWTLASSADVAAWRLHEIYGFDVAQFDPVAKLVLALEQPGLFPALFAGAVGDPRELWLQLIGVLGLFDTVLLGWVYPTLSLLLCLTFLERLPGPATVRLRAGVVAALAAFIYAAGIFVIFYLVWTPIEADAIWGVQGRYFVPVLPLIAVAIGALGRVELGRPLRALAALVGAAIAGGASVEAILRMDWKY